MTTVLDKPPAPVTTLGNLRWWALGALALAVLAVGVDGTVLSVALPTLSKALHASESDLQWFSSGYFLVLAAAMLPAGLLGDRYGHKKVLLVSLAFFGVGSAACAYSRSVGEFMAARVLVGLAGAGLIVMALSVLTVLFGKGERPKAVGIISAATFVAFPIGPILGGWLLTNYWWGWVFLINVPVVVVALAAVVALVPESRASERPGLDLVGVAASAAGLVVLTYGLIKAGQEGWGNVYALAMMVGGVALLVGFFAWERRLTRRPGGQPLLDLSLFGSPSFTWGVSPLHVSHRRHARHLVHHAAVLPGGARYQRHGIGRADCYLSSADSWSEPSPRPESCAWWAPRWPWPPASACSRSGCFSDRLRVSVRAAYLWRYGWRSPGSGPASPWPRPCPPHWSNCRRRKAASAQG